MSVFTFEFYYLSSQGWSYLFGKWWISFLWITLWTLIDYILITGVGGTNAIDIWLRKYPMAVLGWIVGSIYSEVVMRVKPIMLNAGPSFHFYAAGILLQGIIYWLTLAFIASDLNLAGAIITILLHVIYLWIMYGVSQFSGRFEKSEYRISYYRHWTILLFLTDIAFVIASIWLPVDQSNLVHLWTTLGIGIMGLLIVFIIEMIAQTKN